MSLLFLDSCNCVGCCCRLLLAAAVAGSAAVDVALVACRCHMQCSLFLPIAYLLLVGIA